MRILVVTDAWLPQVNGVVRTLTALKAELEAAGHEVVYITPTQFRTFPCPTYSEIRLAVLPGRKMGKMIESFRPCVVHIATEGTLGFAARKYCVRKNVPFTTAFHTKFPEYLNARFRVPTRWTYTAMRWFHGKADNMMVPTQTIENELTRHGFKNIRRWSRGVDTALFKPRSKAFLNLPRPIMLYVGRIAVEKNIEAFLKIDRPGTKLVIGDGPQLDELRRKYPDAVFAGTKQGEELAQYFAAADVFVFPSLTDTFGLVLLEALASGIPVAAYPVPGPLDVIGDAPVGCLDFDLGHAIDVALTRSATACRAHAESFSWAACAKQFISNVTMFDVDSRNPAAQRSYEGGGAAASGIDAAGASGVGVTAAG